MSDIVTPESLPRYPYSTLDAVMGSGMVVNGKSVRVGDSRLPVECASFEVQDIYQASRQEIDAMVVPALETLTDYLRAGMTMEKFEEILGN